MPFDLNDKINGVYGDHHVFGTLLVWGVRG